MKGMMALLEHYIKEIYYVKEITEEYIKSTDCEPKKNGYYLA